MDFEIILNELKSCLSLEHPKNIGQENLDKLIDYAIKNGNGEIIWRIALSFANFDLDFTKVMLYFIEVKDEFYVIETLYAVGDDKIDLKLSKKKY